MLGTEEGATDRAQERGGNPSEKIRPAGYDLQRCLRTPTRQRRARPGVQSGESSEAALANSPGRTGEPLAKVRERSTRPGWEAFPRERGDPTGTSAPWLNAQPPLPPACVCRQGFGDDCSCSFPQNLKSSPSGPPVPRSNLNPQLSSYTAPRFLLGKRSALPVRSPGAPAVRGTPSRATESHQAWASPKAAQTKPPGLRSRPSHAPRRLPPHGIYFSPSTATSLPVLSVFTHKQVVILNQSGSRTAGPEGSNPARLQ